MDLPLLFTMDDAQERRWMDHALFARPEGRGPGLDALATCMQQCWASFCKTGHPGKVYGTLDWPAYPAGMVLTSPKTTSIPVGELPSNGPWVQPVCKYAPTSPEAVLWRRTMDQCGVNPLATSTKVPAAVKGAVGGRSSWIAHAAVGAVIVGAVAAWLMSKDAG
jgi:hypothetical protein